MCSADHANLKRSQVVLLNPVRHSFLPYLRNSYSWSIAAEQMQGEKKPMFDKDGAIGKQFQGESMNNYPADRHVGLTRDNSAMETLERSAKQSAGR